MQDNYDYSGTRLGGSKGCCCWNGFLQDPPSRVRFRRIAATNATFNSTAHAHAFANSVELLTATELMAMVAQTPISRFELESMILAPTH